MLVSECQVQTSLDISKLSKQGCGLARKGHENVVLGTLPQITWAMLYVNIDQIRYMHIHSNIDKVML